MLQRLQENKNTVCKWLRCSNYYATAVHHKSRCYTFSA